MLLHEIGIGPLFAAILVFAFLIMLSGWAVGRYRQWAWERAWKRLRAKEEAEEKRGLYLVHSTHRPTQFRAARPVAGWRLGGGGDAA